MTSDESELDDAQERAERYDAAGIVQKAALKLTGQAPDQRERERLRRHQIGAEGRLAEDVVRAVSRCQPVWELVTAKGLHEDITRDELADIRDAIVGEPSDVQVLPQVSVRFHQDEVRVAAMRNLIPELDTPHEVDGYRYAVWTDARTGAVEPFVIALAEREIGAQTVVGTMFVGAMFLRYELELGTVRTSQLQRAARAAAADVRLIARTHVALLEA